MLTINENNRIYGEEIHLKIESKNSNYTNWLARAIEYADLKENRDFFTKLLKSTGGRPKTQFEFTIEAAKEICLLERNEKGKQIRRWLIDLSSKKDNLELITVKQAAFAVKVINALKYIENQKEAYSIHQKSYVEKEGMSKYIYAEFAKYRAKITGWDKEKVNKALDDYLLTHAGFNKHKLMLKSMSEKLSVIDINEAIRIAVLDILFSRGTDEEISYKFANLVKEMSKELNVEPLKNNETNLFQKKENIELHNISKNIESCTKVENQ